MEKELFSAVNSLWDKLPYWFHISLEVCIVLVLVATVIKYTWPMFKTYIDKRKIKQDTSISNIILKDHSIFQQINFWQCFKINNLDFGDNNRNELFRYIMSIHIVTIEKYLKELSESNIIKNVSKIEYKKYILKMFFDIIKESNYTLEHNLNENIYDLVVASDRGFNQWNEEMIIYTKNLMEMICDSDFYRNNDERTWTLYNTYQSYLDSIILVVEKTYYQFNGDLTELLNQNNRN